MFDFLDLRTFLKNNKFFFILNVFSAIIGNGAFLLAPLFLGKAISSIRGINNVDYQALVIDLSLTALLYLVGAFFLWISYIASGRFTINSVSRIRENLIDKVNKSSIPNLDAISKPVMLNRIGINADMLYDALNYFLIYFIPGVVTVFFGISIIIYLNWYFAIAIILFVPILYIYTKVSTKKTQNNFESIQEQTDSINNLAVQIFDKQKLLIAYNAQEKLTNAFTLDQEKLTKSSQKGYFISSINNPTFRFITNLNYLTLGIIFVLLYYLNQKVDIGVFTSILIYAALFFRPFNELSNFTQNFLLGSTAYKLLCETDSLLDKEIINQKPENLKVEGRFEIKNVSFSYNPKRPLITNFNLSVKKGARIGIVGPTGAGKSTFINLIMRFYQIDDGSILLDDKNIYHYDILSYRKLFGLILQEPWMFSKSIADNIKYGKEDATFEEIVNASIKAGCHEFIMQLKDKYDTIYEDTAFSDGIKQLITIARTILLNPQILILDEATSFIDSLMEFRIQKAFTKLMKNKTTFVIAHRLKMVEDFDTLIVIDNGMIVEQGNHQELMAKKGFYYNLYTSQYQN